MLAVMDSFGMKLTRILPSCEFLEFDLPVVPTVIVLVGGFLFSLRYIGKRYMDVSPLYATPESLSLFSIFVVGVTDFE